MTTNTTPNDNGISIEDAIKVLQARRDAPIADQCDCHYHQAAPPQNSTTANMPMGQCMELFPNVKASSTDDATATPSTATEATSEATTSSTSTSTSETLSKKLQGLSRKELIHVVLQAQYDRVAVYRNYNRCVCLIVYGCFV